MAEEPAAARAQGGAARNIRRRAADPPRCLPPPARSYFENLQGILGSRIVRGLLPPLVCVLLSSYMVCTYEGAAEPGVASGLEVAAGRSRIDGRMAC